MPKTVIYSRIPIKGDHDLSECYKFIKDKEYELISSFIDIGEDGYDFDRKEFNRMRAFIKEGIIDVIVVTSLSEFSRDISKAVEMIKEIESYNVSIHFCDISGVKEDFVGLLDEAINKNNVTFGNDDVVEDEFHSKHDDMEDFLNDFEVVDKSLFDMGEDDDE